jgi:hypothetical protein
MTHLNTMKQALEALEKLKCNSKYSQDCDACEATLILTQAIAEAEKQEPVGYTDEHGNAYQYGYTGPKFAPNIQLYTHQQPKREQGEPVAFEEWLSKQHGDPEEIGFLQALRIAYISGQDSITTPQQRTWVGLDEEDDIDWEEGGSLRDLVKAVEAKLKEKNT